MIAEYLVSPNSNLKKDIVHALANWVCEESIAEFVDTGGLHLLCNSLKDLTDADSLVCILGRIELCLSSEENSKHNPAHLSPYAEILLKCDAFEELRALVDFPDRNVHHLAKYIIIKFFTGF